MTAYLVVGADRLPIRYHAAAAMNTLFDPYPLYGGDFTEVIWSLFEGKPIHRFIRFDPIENETIYTRVSVPCGVKLNLDDKVTDFCTYLSPTQPPTAANTPPAQSRLGGSSISTWCTSATILGKRWSPKQDGVHRTVTL